MQTTARTLTFYTTHSLMSGPREHTALFSGLADELPLTLQNRIGIIEL